MALHRRISTRNSKRGSEKSSLEFSFPSTVAGFTRAAHNELQVLFPSTLDALIVLMFGCSAAHLARLTTSAISHIAPSYFRRQLDLPTLLHHFVDGRLILTGVQDRDTEEEEHENRGGDEHDGVERAIVPQVHEVQDN